jgi:cytochrome c biogenesis protein CcdA
MQFGLGTYVMAAAAGGLSTLSPCVVPLVPILVGSAVTAHRLGPWALASGLALSFTLVGATLASIGTVLGIEVSALRDSAAVLLIAFAVLLLSDRLQGRFAAVTGAASGSGARLLARFRPDGLHGQFALGLLLGLVWSPCVGPTLGAAITLASHGQQLAQVTLVMALFGLGASAPLLLLGFASRAAIIRWRGRLLGAGRIGKKALGAVMLTLGALIVSGADKRIESWLLDGAPEWLVRLGTSL